MLIALTRGPSETLRNCELAHLERVPIDLERARRQHEAYEAWLEASGCTIERLPVLPNQPDAVFVEDTVVVLPELAVITRPGAESRRPETASMSQVMSRYRRLTHVQVAVSCSRSNPPLEKNLSTVDQGRSDTAVERPGASTLRGAVAEYGIRARQAV